jgi:hypothetical protein
MNPGKRFLVSGVIGLLVLAFFMAPAYAQFGGPSEIGSSTITMAPDKTGYTAGEIVYYSLWLSSLVSVGGSFVDDDLMDIITLSPYLENMGFNYEFYYSYPPPPFITYSPCTVDDNTIYCGDASSIEFIPGVVSAWGTIRPGTPPGTEITSYGQSLLEWVAPYGTFLGSVWNSYSSTVTVKNSVPVPEFPSPLLPVTMIIGILGAALFIRRNKEN